MFDTRIVYVPALRAKKGELTGISALRADVASRVIPRLIVPPSNERNPDQDPLFDERGIPGIADAIGDYWFGRSAFIDPSYVLAEFQGSAMGSWLVSAVRHAKVKGVDLYPCIELGKLDEAGEAAFVDVLASLGSYFAICVSLADAFEKDRLALFVSRLHEAGIDFNNSLIIADFKDADLSNIPLASGIIEEALSDLITLAPWARGIFQAGNFPAANPAPKDGGRVWIERSEWLVWQEILRLSPAIGQRFIFGDYAADTSTISQSKARSGAIPHLRYATDRAWLVEREKKGASLKEQIAKVAKNIVATKGAFSGSGFSTADMAIARIAAGIMANGAAWYWRSLNTGRHIAFVVSQIGEQQGYEISKGKTLVHHEQESLFK